MRRIGNNNHQVLNEEPYKSADKRVTNETPPYPLTLCLIAVWLGSHVVTSDSRYKFLGIGYNLLTGNPDGGSTDRGGIDPGLLYTRKIFDLSNPYSVQSESRMSCSHVHKSSIYYGGKSYQDKLKLGVNIEGGGNVGLASFAFTLSSRFEKAKEETHTEHKVFHDDQATCNLGRQRFAEELTRAYSFTITQNFAAAVCRLPSFYDKHQYMKFLDEWGTHVTIEVELGTKNITRHESSLATFVEHVSQTAALDVSVGGSYMGFGGSLEVDFQDFKSRSSYGQKFGYYLTTLLTGTPSLPEPIGLKIKPIHTALSPEYWRNTSLLTSNHVCTAYDLGNLPKVQANLITAVSDYATYRAAPTPTNPELKIPLAWPRGTYGLYQPKSGCPSGGFNWFQGKLYQDLEDYKTHNQFSNGLHLRGISATDNDIVTFYCIKGRVQMTEYDLDWPKGDYCIAKYGSCPTGFREGWLHWDDEDDNNRNSYSGYLPDGVYKEDTTMYYCCRNDSLPTMEINLPNDKPFYLLRHTHSCQRVRGMRVNEETVFYDEEWFLFTSRNQKAGGFHPYDDGDHDNHRLHFCYYRPASYVAAGNAIVG